LTKKEIVYVEISFLAHATEDQDKVLTAVRNLFYPKHFEELIITKKKLRGEYGNPIILYETQLRNEVAEVFLRNIGAALSFLDKESLLRKLALRLNKGNLYLRLDKQAALASKVKFCFSDPIRVRIKFRSSKIEEITEIIRRLGMVP